MKKMIKVYNFIIVAVLLAVSGCAKYNPKSSLRVLNTGVLQQSGAKESTISFEYHVFNKHDCKKYLDRNVISMGYQPIQITFTNNTKQHLTFSTDKFSFPCVADEEVAEKVHSNTKGRAAGYGVAAIFVLPFAIPAIVDGIGSSEANKKLDRDYSRKALSERVVKQGETINGLIFVPVKSFDPNFTFSVTDTKNNKKYTLSPSNCMLKI